MTGRTAAYGASLVVVSSLFYGSYGVWTKLMGDSFGSYMQAGLRCLVVVGCLLPLAIWHKQLSRIHWRRDAKWLGGMLLGATLSSPPLYYATLQIGIGLATAISYAGIMIGLFIFGWLLNRERYTKDKAIATVLGLVGLWLIFSPSLQGFGFLGLGAAFLSGLAVSVNIAMCQKIQYNATQTTIMTWSLGAITNLPLAFFLGEAIPRAHDIHWLYLIIFGLISIVASWSVIRGSKLIAAGAVGILGLLEIVFGVLFGVMFFGERPGPIVLLGMLTILAAAAIPYVRHFKLKDEPFSLEEREK